jgi:ketosteroid isomerase-like protein
VAEEWAERAEIRDALVRYTVAFRRKDVDHLDGVFTPDAVLDYRESGGPLGDWPTTKHWIASVLEDAHLFLLYIGDSTYRFQEDQLAADVETSWHGVFITSPDGPTMQVYGTYEDRFVRTGDGWKILARTDHPAWQAVHSAPIPVQGG